MSAMAHSGGYLLVGEDDADKGAVLLRSPLLDQLGVCHGFATRRGGVSTGSFESLNFGLKGGDSPDNVRRNLQRVASRVSIHARDLFRVRQVHGRRVLVLGAGDDPSAIHLQEADGLVTSHSGQAVGVVTADCVPVLFSDCEARVVGVAHAGWRGVVAGILEATIEALKRVGGCTSQRLRAALGPSIGPCCYEVGPEVAVHFERMPSVVQQSAGQRPHLDLAAAVRHKLHGAGMPPDAISHPDLCTCCRSDLLFSYRRDGSATGHQLSLISAGSGGSSQEELPG